MTTPQGPGLTDPGAAAATSDPDDFAHFDEIVAFRTRPVARVPLTADEERALMRDLDEFDETRARAEVESRGLFIGRAAAR